MARGGYTADDSRLRCNLSAELVSFPDLQASRVLCPFHDVKGGNGSFCSKVLLCDLGI